MASRDKKFFPRLPSLSARFHIAFGLTSLITSLTLASVFSGLVPDRQSIKAANQIMMAEALATSSSMLLRRSDMSGISTSLEFIVNRNDDLEYVELLRHNDKNTVRFASSAQDLAEDPGIADSVDGESQGNFEVVMNSAPITVPLMRGNREWGELRFGFKSVKPTGWRAYIPKEPYGLLLFMSLLSFPLFYLYLGRMLKELNPSAAVPSRVRSALDTIAESLLVIDRRGNVVLANEAFAELAGREAESLIGMHAKDLAWVHNDDQNPEYPWMQALQSAESTRHEMVTFRDAKGLPRKFIVNCSPVAAASGKAGGVLMSMDDVTLLEEKEVQLRQSMQLAEEANQAKSAFLSTMSHEIRTPMTAILGFTEVLRRGNVQTDEERKRHLGTIANSGQHLLELINDVLDLSKVESGAMEFEQLGTQPLQPVLEVIDVLGVKAREKGIDLKLDHPDQVPASVTTDPARLRQIIVNLVGNAIKFTDQGEVVVEFGFDIENEQMHFVVRDTGIGMDEQQQEAAFDAFTQADVSITRRFGGTGLGLSISRQLSRALGGDISVDSVIGQGSVFTVTLPTGSLRNVPLLNRAELFQQMELDNLSTAQEWSFPDAKILVVDDGAENRELLTLVLSELGVEITTAENGQQAVEQVQAGDFDVVLMDIQMPVMDGYQAVSIIREQGHDLPVVALTANAMRGFEERVLAAGFSHYQTKPIDIDRLCNLLASLLDVDAATAIEGTQTELPIADPWKGSQMQAPIVSRLSCENERFVPIVDQFIEKFEARFKALQPALKTQDWAVIEETANWLKGAGPTVGFDCLKRPAARLESAAIERSSRAVEAQYQGLLDLKVRLVSEGSITNVHDELSEPVESADNPVVSTLLKVHPKFASVVDRFIVRLMEELDSLELSLRSGNMDAVARFAHWLKGSGGNVGFDGFVSMATSLEQAARQQDRTAVLEISAEVQAYAARVRAGWHDPDSDSRAA